MILLNGTSDVKFIIYMNISFVKIEHALKFKGLRNWTLYMSKLFYFSKYLNRDCSLKICRSRFCIRRMLKVMMSFENLNLYDSNNENIINIRSAFLTYPLNIL